MGNPTRLTEMTRPGWSWGAWCATVIFNPEANEYLLVWTGQTGRLGFIGECATDIFFQRLSAAAVPLGTPTRIWGCFPISYGVLEIPPYASPAVAHNAVTNGVLCGKHELGFHLGTQNQRRGNHDHPRRRVHRRGLWRVAAAANDLTGEYLLAWNDCGEDSVQARLRECHR